MPDERIVERVTFLSDDPAFSGTMTVTTALRTVANGTEVRIVCENVPAGIRESVHRKGIASTLANIAAFTE